MQMTLAMNNLSRFCRLVLLSLFPATPIITGCTPHYSGVFVNGEDQRLSVSLYSYNDNRLTAAFDLNPGSSIKQPLVIVRAEVRNSRGDKIFEQTIPPSGSDVLKTMNGETTFYFLVTSKGIHLMPKKYVDCWREHISEISGPSGH